MANIELNGKRINAGDNETIVTAAKRAGVTIPTLCHMEDLTPSGACRVCVVEVEGNPNLVTACSTMVREGMKIRTHSERVLDARKTIVELLLANHPDDCLYCDSKGKCELQNLARELHVTRRRYRSDAQKRAELDVSHPSIVRNPNKCILCGRCVRVCEEIQTVAAVDFIRRGSQSRIGAAFDKGLNASGCVGCGQCVMVCPTGAL
ncbi:MAG: 4Fe-4S dicluster domain-containing protein, partial [Planctomycetaceae bacterium]